MDLAEGEREYYENRPDVREYKNTNFNYAISDELPTEEPWAAERAGRKLE